MEADAYLEMAATEDRHWWFAGRRRILSSVIVGLNLPRDAQVLEIGSGTGGNLMMLSRFGQVSAMEMDANARAIAMAKTGGRFDIRAGICPHAIPFSEQRFDLICMIDVLEHIEDDVGTLCAIKNHLKPGGRVLISVPAYSWLWSAHDEFLHHKRRYGSGELQQKFDAAGLRLLKLSHFNTILFPLAAAARLIGGASKSPGTATPPLAINWVLQELYSFERFVLKFVDLPFGLSQVAVAGVE